MGDYVLGLDLGSNSIGWAMVEAREVELGGHVTHEPIGLFDTSAAGHPPLGVRVFEAGLDNFGSSKEKSLSQDRRVARSMRRNHQRRNDRRKKLKRDLVRAGLLPGSPKDQERVFLLDPYRLRARALDEPLQPHELGRALYHLGQRRGFKSNRKTGKSKEDKGMLGEIKKLEGAIEASGARTLGEHLYRLSQAEGDDSLHQGAFRLRARHTQRGMYEHEFNMIIASQRPHHPEALSAAREQAFHEAIFHQRPFEISEERRLQAPSRANLHRAPSLRRCPLEPSEFCCPKAEWDAQEFRILKEVNNLRVAEHFGLERELTPEEREAVLDRLSDNKQAKFDDLRKCIAESGGDPDARFNLERGSRKYLDGNLVAAVLRKAFPAKRWRELTIEERRNLVSLMLSDEKGDDLRAVLLEAGAKEDKLETVVEWSPPDGYLAYSRCAIRKLLPPLREGLSEDKAIERAYPERPEAHAMDRLPSLSDPDLPVELKQITNPIVRRALVEVRKVVNAIVREHGRPLRVVVELAREMKGGPEERKRWAKTNQERRELREQARDKVFDLGGNPRSRSDVQKYLLWQEQGGMCLYTAACIPQSELFHGGEWEVDHILPRWKSLDDSMMNKVLVNRSANQAKGDSTPAEWLGVESQEFLQLVQRAEDLKTKGKLPWGKLSRIKQEHVEADGFALRQLNDTRYITKMVVKYLGLLYEPEQRVGEKAVQSCRGSLTAELRRQWQLSNLLEPLVGIDGTPVLSAERDADGQLRKSRADHRHHAIDAVVIALSSRASLKRYQEHWKSRAGNAPWSEARRHMDDGALALPWEQLREDVRKAAAAINVSHRPVRKLGGAFHEETFLGQAKEGGRVVPGTYVTRKNLKDIKPAMVPRIRDGGVRQLIIERLMARGWNGKDNTLPKNWWMGPEIITSSGKPVRKVRILVRKRSLASLGHRFAVLGNTHHVAVYEQRDGRKRSSLAGEVVPRMAVARRVRMDGREAVDRNKGDGWKFLMSLARKESVLVRSPITDEVTLCVVQKVSGSDQVGTKIDLTIRDARDSRPASLGNRTPFKRIASYALWQMLGICKVQVDPLGRPSRACD